MRTFEYRDSDGITRGMVLGVSMQMIDENTFAILNENDTIIAIFTPKSGESVAETPVPEPELASV